MKRHVANPGPRAAASLAPPLAPRLALCLALVPALLAGGCTRVGPNFETPAPPPPQAGYGAAGDARAVIGQGPELAWWTAFGSKRLDTYVDQAIVRNQTLAASLATLDKAQHRIEAVAGKRLPQVDANGRVEHERVNLAAFGLGSSLGGSSGFSNPEFNLYSLGGGVQYDLDLFGRNARSLEQARADAEAQRFATQGAHLTIAGRVVVQVLAIAGLNDLISTQQRLLDEDDRNLSLTRAREKAGVGTLVEVLSAQGQLASDRSDLPDLQQQRDEGRAMLAVLLGITPEELGPTDFGLSEFALPAKVPVTMPSALVRKRPDILEAEAKLHSAVAAVGVATAQLYPDITLGATLAQSTSEPGKILSGNYNAFDLFGMFTAPIFHGGTLRANKRGAQSEAQAAAARYREVVLEAFGQVSGLLSALKNDSQAIAVQSDTAGIAQRSLHLSRRSFQVGNSGILQVLDASRTAQRAEIALEQAKARQYQNIARLYAATAGGWLPDEPGTQRETVADKD